MTEYLPSSAKREQKFFDIRTDATGCPVLFYGDEPAADAYRSGLDTECHILDWDENGCPRIRKARDREQTRVGPQSLFRMWASADISPLGRAALDYAARGIPVFPCKQDRKPLTDHALGLTSGFKSATTDLKTVATYWGKYPDALIGVPTGHASGIAVLDLDVKNGKDGTKHVREWESRSNVIARTQSDGIHLYFANDDRVRSQSDQIAPGVDTRGNGGYVIVPPSTGYTFVKGDLSDRSTLLSWPEDMFPKERERTEQTSEDAAPGNTTDYEQARIAAALNVIPSDSYQIWFEVGCALRYALGSAGFELFEKWSAKSTKYEKQECIKQWDACGAVAKFTLGTLFHHADSVEPNWREEFESKYGKPLILPSSEFVAGFQPPDYLIDGILQRGFLYSKTAPTSTGKTAIALRIAAHVSRGELLAGHAIESGKVLYFAGENPDDIRTRWIKLCEEMTIDPDNAGVFFVAGALSISKMLARIKNEAKIHGPFALIVVDTLAAYFEGDDENANRQMLVNARLMRSLTEVAGKPTVIVTCHPTKNADPEKLWPRGGGAFLAEVDGNLVCLKRDGFVDLHWQGKFRGPDFSAMPFKIESGFSERLKDSKGRKISTVTARPISMQERGALENTSASRQNELLIVMQSNPGLSLVELAAVLNWKQKGGEPNKALVWRMMQGLKTRGLVKKEGADHWELTARGKKFKPGDGLM